jgi:hypothetical protein
MTEGDMPVIIDEIAPAPAPRPEPPAPTGGRAEAEAAAERALRLAALRREREARLAPP